MNTESITARNVGEGQLANAGDFKFDEGFEHIYIITPGTTYPDSLRINKGGDTGEARTWGWDGNKDKPTLTPSIGSPHWHGHLKNGELVSC